MKLLKILLEYAVERHYSNLKGKSKGNLFDIFENFNSTIDMNIKLAKIDNDHSLKNLNGKVIIKNMAENKQDVISVSEVLSYFESE